MSWSFKSSHCALALALVAMVSGCAKAPTGLEPRQFSVVFEVRDDAQRALAGALIRVGEREVGMTASDGILRQQLPGPEGATLPVRITCPDEHELVGDLPPLRLTTLLGLDQATATIRYTASCKPQARSVAVVVRARGIESVPVSINGSVVGRTDTNGVAHHLLKLKPGAKLRVELDTSARLTLQPKNPGLSFTVEDDDSILLLDQQFQLPPPKPRWRPKPKAKPQRHVPYRLN